MKLLQNEPGELAEKLQKYLENDRNFLAVYEHTRIKLETADLPAHNWTHTYRDILNAIVIGEAERADMSVVLPAITMHDIGFLYGATGKTHGSIGADKLVEFLNEGKIILSSKAIEDIADCIRTHKGSMHDETPISLEAKVVADADLIEKFGPVGVYQYIRTFTEFNYSLDAILNRIDTMAKLSLETETGRTIAEPGRQFVIDFFIELKEAVAPYRGKDTGALM